MILIWLTHQNVKLLIRLPILIYLVAKKQVMTVNLSDQEKRNTNAAD